MFIGWLRVGFENDLETLQKEFVDIDRNIIKYSYLNSPNLCFGAYENDKLIAILTAYEFENYIYITALYALNENVDLKLKLLNLLISNSFDMTILLLSRVEDAKAFKGVGFKSYAPFSKFVQRGESVAFNFSDTMAKQVNSDNFERRAKNLDLKVFKENREEFLDSIFNHKTSLKLSTGSGFLHSYVVNKSFVKISPWIMGLESFMDAEKLLRGVLYYRGLKIVYAFIPTNIDEIVELYHQYKFKNEGNYRLQYLGEEPNIRLESLYAL